MTKYFFFTFLLIVIYQTSHAQGQLSGDLQVNARLYQRDSTIGADNTPLYDNLFTAAESWLQLNYSILGFTAGIRFDLFHNSDLFNKQQAYTDQGIGRWYVSKEIKDLKITGGYFYDQIGSGIIFRAYEERGLGIDNAIYGLKLDYKINDNWHIKGFTGKQKNLFTTFRPVIRGINVEGTLRVGKNIISSPGVGLVNRTIDKTSMDNVVNNINSYPLEMRFVPKYNVYAYSAYNTLNYKNFSWYAEYDYKTREALTNADGILVNVPGTVVFTTLGYSVKGFGITAQYKRTENFSFRTSPNETLLQGIINFLPPLTRQNTFRLTSRYSAATKDLSETALEADIVYTPQPGYTLSLNYSDIKTLNNQKLFREYYGELEISKYKKMHYVFGLQRIFYNIKAYRLEGDEPVISWTPLAEFNYHFSRKHSLRSEVQYQYTKQDMGQWAYALVEYNIAPKFSFSVSDMYNLKPVLTDAEKKHYYSFFTSFTKDANRFTLSYVKQVAGINCTGGVYRYEPAFSGIKFTLNSTF